MINIYKYIYGSCVILQLNVVDILVNGQLHSIPYSAQQVTFLCSQRTGANLPVEYLLFQLLVSV